MIRRKFSPHLMSAEELWLEKVATLQFTDRPVER